MIITYFTACLFYFISSLQGDDNLNFMTYNGIADETYSNFYKCIMVCYMSITTLSTVGYGDLYPISNLEKVIGIVIMLSGVGFFSYVMSSFIQIQSTLEKENSSRNEDIFEVHNWITLLTRFRENKPLPNTLYRQVFRHFEHFASNDRL